MVTRFILVLGVVGGATSAGLCIGVLQKIHPLNEDSEKLTKTMLGLCLIGTVFCALGAVIYGK